MRERLGAIILLTSLACVEDFGSLETCWTRSMILGDSRRIAVLGQLLAPKEDPSLELALRVTDWKLGIIFHNDREHTPYVCVCAIVSSVTGNVGPFFDALKIPRVPCLEFICLLR